MYPTSPRSECPNTFEARKMATPTAVRALRAVSIFATGGAAMYLVSDGGDARVLEERAEAARARAETLPDQVGDLYAAAVARLPDVSSIQLPSFDLSSMTSGMNQTPAVPASDMAEQTQVESMSTTSGARGVCHTCSGPRIWYLTDKFRIKRRISPHSDPTEE